MSENSASIRKMLFCLLLGVTMATAVPATAESGVSVISVSGQVPQAAGAAVLSPFVSFSIEFSSFPDFAGNLSRPNKFSKNLLDNLGDLQGVKPYLRVGGNTQDLALYDPSLKTQINGTVVPAVSSDYPSIISIGPSYFESYATLPGVKFSHGFNMGNNSTRGIETLLATVSLACKALGGGKLEYWEIGNEPDLFKTTTPNSVRPANWTESDYVTEWLERERVIRRQLKKSCPEMLTDDGYKYIAPSFAGLTNSLDAVKTWQDGLNKDNIISLNSMHNYIGGADVPGVTLRHTLMNHTATKHSVDQHVNLSRVLSHDGLTKDIPYILGETNSLYHQGKPGLSNSFGAALWGVDFNLYCASQSIRRTHMHMGTDYRYASWQPIETNKTTVGTKAPYYGNVMVAAMLKKESDGDDVQVVNLPTSEETNAAYASYVNGHLARIAVVNMQQFNYTDEETGAISELSDRRSTRYTFQIPTGSAKSLSVQRLMANGSDAITGITWDGWSYNYELDNGKPVRQSNVTIGELVIVKKGVVEIELPYSSGAILNL
ncbi:hypothetical protein MYU51_006263 [Penicillium brevicompactum]|uniref:uncharacterized protein n=1 Tax=Penicillium brevicompactum TaxID=5074 RepID=UPI002541A4D7|nr:uncharacterized protein N7506_004985 [Penicillium brevicompactum]KAJ5336963.1 hypothetical protein N7506_004985 [Penicillium brevicompactum]